jgi:hypothetical protein
MGFDGAAAAVLAAILLLDRRDLWARARTTLTPP